MFHTAIQRLEHILTVKGLDQIMCRLEPKGVNGKLAAGADHDHIAGTEARRNALEHIDAGQIFHINIRKQNIGVGIFQKIPAPRKTEDLHIRSDTVKRIVFPDAAGQIVTDRRIIIADCNGHSKPSPRSMNMNKL